MPKRQHQLTISLTTVAALSRKLQISQHLVKRAAEAGDIETLPIAGRVYLLTKSADAWGGKILANTAPARAVA